MSPSQFTPLSLPLRAPRPEDERLPAFAAAEAPPPVAIEVLTPASNAASVNREVASGRVTLTVENAQGFRVLGGGRRGRPRLIHPRRGASSLGYSPAHRCRASTDLIRWTTRSPNRCTMARWRSDAATGSVPSMRSRSSLDRQ